MELKVKFMKWSAGLPVAMLNRKTANKMGIQETGRISIKTLSKRPKEMSILVDTIEKGIVKEKLMKIMNQNI